MAKKGIQWNLAKGCFFLFLEWNAENKHTTDHINDHRGLYSTPLEKKSHIDRISAYGFKCKDAVANGHPRLQIKGYGCRA